MAPAPGTPPLPPPPNRPTTKLLPASVSSVGSENPSVKQATIPAPSARIGAGAALVIRGAANMAAMVRAPTTMPCQRQEDGASASQKWTPRGAPRKVGVWLVMITRPTPLR
jgi:hypothetical protein